MENEKIYVVISSADGEDFYNTNQPIVERCFRNLKDAKDYFEEIKPGFMPDEEDEYEENATSDTYYEVTDFSQDYHAVLQIVETELF